MPMSSCPFLIDTWLTVDECIEIHGIAAMSLVALMLVMKWKIKLPEIKPQFLTEAWLIVKQLFKWVIKPPKK